MGDDCIRGYLHLINDLRIPPHRICVMGDSAGGSLVLQVLEGIHQKTSGNAENVQQNPLQPFCAVLLSPWTDMTRSTNVCSTFVQNRKRDIFRPEAVMRLANMVADCCPSGSLADPRISPLHYSEEELKAFMPPCLVLCGEREL